ncbi:putative erythritol ABC transporter 2, permease component [Rubellimicrobium mesophilum DSM 19309]|uniref:Putative erythritol ABC transporter 2, permease component n=1 Tax=Rubellimicrobium mesophilum DSM 19309 TaxID=442562 RepID=A0A017HT30_9RHOB|nr:putative erythritol ABC transporter 2, permease component [Rubellimicrobium mesophilum DSM 19309]
MAIYGLLAVGMLLVVLNGGIDLSVGSVLGLCGVVAGAMMKGVEIAPMGVILYPPVWAVVVLTLALGAAIGAVNGVLVAYLKVPAFVATLGVMYVARGIALLMTNGLTYNGARRRPRARQHGLRLARAREAGGHPHQHHHPRRGRLCGEPPAGPRRLRPLALLLGRERPRGRAVGRAGQGRADLGLRALGHLRGDRRAHALLQAQLGRPHGGHHLRAHRHRGGGDRRRRAHRRPGHRAGHDAGRLRDRLPVERPRHHRVSSYWQTVFTGAVIVLAVLLNSIRYGGRARKPAASPASPPPGRPA